MKDNETDGTCSTLVRDEKRIQNFDRKPKGKRPPGTPRRRWEDIIMDLKRNRKGECGLDSSV